MGIGGWVEFFFFFFKEQFLTFSLACWFATPFCKNGPKTCTCTEEEQPLQFIG